ncbi:MAG: hypothetical protein O6952_03320 [Planctomycetota bacterium]|nr:hypothetical protein [Planctomycetota bacterium]
MDLQDLLQAVKEAGFKAEWIELEVTGAISPLNSQGPEKSAKLHIESTGQDILLIPGDEEETGRNHAEVMTKIKDGKTWMRIRGRTPSDPGENLEMSISVFEILEKPERRVALRVTGLLKSKSGAT